MANRFTKALDLDWREIGELDESVDTTEVAFDTFKGVTDGAALFVIDGDDVWIPRSCIRSVGNCEVEMSERMAIDKGLV